MNSELKDIRRKIIEIAYNSQEGHIASSLSIVEILYSLYKDILKSDDYFILSKGHAALGWYAALNHFGHISDIELETFCKENTCLPGHPVRNKLLCISASTGSLGHGLPMGAGIALGLKASGRKGKVYVLVGDGEMNEGSSMEAVNLAAYHELDNLCCIVDYNGSADRALTTHLPGVFSGFGWCITQIGGHSTYDINYYISKEAIPPKIPLAIIARTVKGCGVSFMENNPEWHHKKLNKEQYELAMEELK